MTQRGKAWAPVGNEQHMASLQGQCTTPTTKGREILCPHAPAVTKVATAHLGGAAARGSSTPSFFLDSLEEAFLPRTCHTSPNHFSFTPTGVLHKLPYSAGQERGVYSTGKWTTTQEHMHSQGQSRAHTPPLSKPHTPASTTWEIGTHFLLYRPPQREPLMGHTHHHGRDPRGTLG